MGKSLHNERQNGGAHNPDKNRALYLADIEHNDHHQSHAEDQRRPAYQGAVDPQLHRSASGTNNPGINQTDKRNK